MNIAVFDLTPEGAAQANAFAKTVELEKNEPVQVKDGKIVVLYKPELTEEQEVANRLRQSKRDLILFRIHQRFLGVVKAHDHAAKQDAQDKTDYSAQNAERAVELFENWDQPTVADLVDAAEPKKKAAKK